MSEITTTDEAVVQRATRRFNDLVSVLQDAGMTQTRAGQMVRDYTDAVRQYDAIGTLTDEPFTPKQALNILRNMATRFAALDEHLKTKGDFPGAWDRGY
jgi:hypothetical protein